MFAQHRNSPLKNVKEKSCLIISKIRELIKKVTWLNLFNRLADDATWSSSKCSDKLPLLFTDCSQNCYVGLKLRFTPTISGVTNFDVLLTVHLSIFMSVINQLDAQSFVLQ